jgi:hypothetical protein
MLKLIRSTATAANATIFSFFIFLLSPSFLFVSFFQTPSLWASEKGATEEKQRNSLKVPMLGPTFLRSTNQPFTYHNNRKINIRLVKEPSRQQKVPKIGGLAKNYIVCFNLNYFMRMQSEVGEQLWLKSTLTYARVVNTLC